MNFQFCDLQETHFYFLFASASFLEWREREIKGKNQQIGKKQNILLLLHNLEPGSKKCENSGELVVAGQTVSFRERNGGVVRERERCLLREVWFEMKTRQKRNRRVYKYNVRLWSDGKILFSFYFILFYLFAYVCG